MDNDKSMEGPISWLEWYLLRESAQKINTEAKQTLFQMFDAKKSANQIKSDTSKHNETVFVFKQNFGKNKINFFHNLTLLGGSFIIHRNIMEQFKVLTRG